MYSQVNYGMLALRLRIVDSWNWWYDGEKEVGQARIVCPVIDAHIRLEFFSLPTEFVRAVLPHDTVA